MIERTVPVFGRLVFDRDAIIRAALRAYIECFFAKLPNCISFPAAEWSRWTGDLQRGAFYNDNGCGDYEVVAWTKVGVVGLAYDLGSGPIEQLDLSIDAVTGGPDDVRGAVPGLPEELEPTFVIAVGMLHVGPHWEKEAGAGFWLYGDRVGGTLFLFDDLYSAHGVDRLAAWGKLRGVRGDRLPLVCAVDSIVFYPDEPTAVPIHAIIDAVVDRRLRGPTELTRDELATLLCREPDPEQLLAVQRRLQEVGITWPGSPKLPEAPPEPRTRIAGYSNRPPTTVHTRRRA